MTLLLFQPFQAILLLQDPTALVSTRSWPLREEFLWISIPLERFLKPPMSNLVIINLAHCCLVAAGNCLHLFEVVHRRGLLGHPFLLWQVRHTSFHAQVFAAPSGKTLPHILRCLWRAHRSCWSWFCLNSKGSRRESAVSSCTSPELHLMRLLWSTEKANVARNRFQRKSIRKQSRQLCAQNRIWTVTTSLWTPDIGIRARLRSSRTKIQRLEQVSYCLACSLLRILFRYGLADRIWNTSYLLGSWHTLSECRTGLHEWPNPAWLSRHLLHKCSGLCLD